MKLTVLGSGSKGNCYLLHNDDECLILEAGVPFSEVLRVLKGNIKKVVACLISHEHGDHIKYAGDMLAHGINTYMTPGTWHAKRWMRYYPLMLEKGIEMKKGNFTILPFTTVHDAAEPCGFLIHHRDMGTVLFATDTAYIPNTFEGLTNIIIECNYDESLLASRDDIPDSLKDRIRQSHQSIDTCIEALKANDLSMVNNIVLIHISDGDGDKERFRCEVQQHTGKQVHIATPDLDIDFNKTPF